MSNIIHFYPPRKPRVQRIGQSVSDKELVARFLAATEHLSIREAADLIGVSHGNVTRWKAGDFTRLHPSTRRRVREFLDGRAGEERPEDVDWAVREEGERYDADRAQAEEIFRNLEEMIRNMARDASPEQAKLRRLDGLEGLRRFFSARGPLPDWWYEIKRKVDNDEPI